MRTVYSYVFRNNIYKTLNKQGFKEHPVPPPPCLLGETCYLRLPTPHTNSSTFTRFPCTLPCILTQSYPSHLKTQNFSNNSVESFLDVHQPSTNSASFPQMFINNYFNYKTFSNVLLNTTRFLMFY
jgi:hypothetical protein